MRIHVVPGGPMLVEGVPLGRLRRAGATYEVDAIRIDGRTNGQTDGEAGGRYALCRCGASGSMPFCDRPAPNACFEEEPQDGPPPAPFRWDVPDPAGPPAIALKPDGPIRVAGGAPITVGDRTLPSSDRVSICRCGASRSQPLCDGSHKIVGYRD